MVILRNSYISLFCDSPDWLWGPPRLQINEYVGLSGRSVNLTMNLSRTKVRMRLERGREGHIESRKRGSEMVQRIWECLSIK